MKLFRTITATTLFLALLVATYYLHMRFFKVDVVFYAAIADAILAVIATGIVLFTARYFQKIGTFEKFQLTVIWLLIGYSLAISLPTVIDRSLSFYILEKLQQRGGGIKQARMEQVFIQEYMKEHHLIDVRLTEQLESGTIEINNGCVQLTTKGSFIANASRIFRKHWLPRERLLMGSYTDALTDPFRNSEKVADYQCPQ